MRVVESRTTDTYADIVIAHTLIITSTTAMSVVNYDPKMWSLRLALLGENTNEARIYCVWTGRGESKATSTLP